MRITRIRATVALSATAACAAASLAVTMGPATADPWAGAKPLVAVGSDTIQYVDDALGRAGLDPNYALSSYDATDPADGTTTHGVIYPDGVTPMLRPKNSGEGQQAISAALAGYGWPSGPGTDGTGTGTPGVSLVGKVAVGRSSGGPNNTSGTDLTFIPLARDAVGFAVITSGPSDPILTGGAVDLTAAQINAIYAGTSTTINGITVTPYLPPAGSGTRSFFEKAIGGLSDTTAAATVGSHTHQENALNGLPLHAVVPISVAAWVAQSKGTVQNLLDPGSGDKAVLASIDLAKNGTYVPPVTDGSNPDTGLTQGYYNDSNFGRDVYNVVSTARLKSDANFANYFSKSLTSATANTIIGNYGFLAESYDGGTDPSTNTHVKQAGLIMPGGTGAQTSIANVSIPFTSVPTPVIKGTTATGSISGNVAVGSKLTASVADATPVQDSYTYQWYANGTAISGATASTLTVPASAAGKALTVTVTAAKVYYTAATSAASAATGKVKPGTLTAATPKISGTIATKKKVGVKTGTWGPKGVKLYYQWLNNGKAIAKATKSTYTIPKTLKNHSISVKITGKLAGYTTISKVSKATKIKK